MKKNLLFIFLLTLIGNTNYGQATTKDLFKIFKKSIRQENREKVSVGSNPWIICNRDSAYFNSDTLVMHNDNSYYDKSKCCDFIEWTFYRKNAFYFGKKKMCPGIPQEVVDKENRWFTLRKIKLEKVEALELLEKGKIVDRFKLLSIKKILGGRDLNSGQNLDSYPVVTLVRIR